MQSIKLGDELKSDNKEEVAVDVCREDAFNIDFRPDRFNRAFLYLSDLGGYAGAVTCFIGRVVLPRLIRPSYRGHAIVPAETTRWPE